MGTSQSDNEIKKGKVKEKKKEEKLELKKSEEKKYDEKEEEKFLTNLIEIKIKMNSIVIWERTYNIEENFQQIYKDFISENKYENGFNIKWNYNNINIEFNPTKLKNFIKENNLLDISLLEINQEIFEDDYEKNIEFIDYIAVPIFNPFSILIYDKNNNILKRKIFEHNDFLNNLIKFGVESSYCNGGDHFFLLGGTNSSTSEELGIFLDVDLKDETINNQITISPTKRNHSMLYSQKKVYIVGGNDEITLLYDLKHKMIENIKKLNKKRFEPSLIRHKDHLYCFDASRKIGDKFSFEKLNLNDISNSSWEIVYPKISPDLGGNVYNQKFFGIVEDNHYNIIFVGGMYDSYSDEKYETNSEIYNIKYNLFTNTVEKSDIVFQEISLIEKTFVPFDDNTSFLLLNPRKKKPKIIKFYKNDKRIEISELNYTENEENTKKIKNNVKYSYMKKSLLGINFDMPTKIAAIKTGENSTKNENNDEELELEHTIVNNIEGNKEKEKEGNKIFKNELINDNTKNVINQVSKENNNDGNNLNNNKKSKNIGIDIKFIDNETKNSLISKDNKEESDNNLISPIDNHNEDKKENTIIDKTSENKNTNKEDKNENNKITNFDNVPQENIIDNINIKDNINEKNKNKNDNNPNNKFDNENFNIDNTKIIKNSCNNNNNPHNNINNSNNYTNRNLNIKNIDNNTYKDKEKINSENKTDIIIIKEKNNKKENNDNKENNNYYITNIDNLDINIKEISKLAKKNEPEAIPKKIIKKKRYLFMKKNKEDIIENNY